MPRRIRSRSMGSVLQDGPIVQMILARRPGPRSATSGFTEIESVLLFVKVLPSRKLPKDGTILPASLARSHETGLNVIDQGGNSLRSRRFRRLQGSPFRQPNTSNRGVRRETPERT